MKAAFYGRYSTDHQGTSSLERQFRNCEMQAQREGWTLSARYEDPRISGGTRMRERPAGARLLADAEAKQFDVILIDDLSRAFRHQGDQYDTLELLRYHGVHVVSVNDGVDTRNEDYDLPASMLGIISARYRKDIAKKVHGQLSLNAASGKSAGGLPYGYKVIYQTTIDDKGRASSKPVDRVIDPEKARCVRRIFAWYASGWSPRAIAGELNRLRVPSPRNGKWMGSAILPMLTNSIYIGKQIWNRTKWIDRPESVNVKKGLKGKKQRFERPESQWITTDVPALRIVRQVHWDEVQSRRRRHTQEFGTMRYNHHPEHRPNQKFPWSGILKCAECGRNFIIVNQRSYGCASRINGGTNACGNTLLVRRSLVEEKLFAAIKDLFPPRHTKRAIKESMQLLGERSKAKRLDLDAAKQALEKTQQVIANVVGAIKAGAFSAALKAELAQAEAERERLQAVLDVDHNEAANVAAFLHQAVNRHKVLMANIHVVALRDVARVRGQLRVLVGGRVPLRPNPTREFLIAELSGHYAGLATLTARKISVDLR
jgi:site-specific DNA recombinase